MKIFGRFVVIVILLTPVGMLYWLTENQDKIPPNLEARLTPGTEVSAPIAETTSKDSSERAPASAIEEIKKPKAEIVTPPKMATAEPEEDLLIDEKITGEKILPISPTPGQRVNPKQVTLKWLANPNAEIYMWEISRDKDFNSIFRSGESLEDSVSVEQLPEDKLYWRVSAKDNDGLIIPSGQIRAFRVAPARSLASDEDDSQSREVPVTK